MFGTNVSFQIIALYLLLSINFTTAGGRICGTTHVRSKTSNFSKLENCTVIEGSLAIALLQKSNESEFRNISFPDLVEITGYLLVYQVYNLPSLGQLFPNLTLIRGQELLNDYALIVSDVDNLKEVGLSKLSHIERGSVAFQNNPELCYVTSIDWQRITNYRPGNDFKNNKLQCNICNNAKCHKSTNLQDERSLNKVVNNILCWSENVCQRICDKDCKQQTCFSHNETICCPDACLGSCYNQNLTSEQIRTQTKPNKTASVDYDKKQAVVCTICRHVEHEGQCLDKCPPGLYKFKNRRCVTKKECIRHSVIYRNFEISDKKSSIYLKPVNMENGTSLCVKECPEGYMINPENSHSCIKCTSKCFKQCDGGRIGKLESSVAFRKCTRIKGDLVISIQDSSPNLAETLEQNLGSIETIDGYLRIAKSTSLHSLHFLKSLRDIDGETLDRGGEYSLVVMGNANLAELFWVNPNLTQPQLKINKGKIFFQLNPKLCLKEIYSLKNISNIEQFPANDVPDFSNGDKAICHYEKINVHLMNATDSLLKIYWTKFQPDDFRTLLGYDIWYKESEQENITSYFENRDVCNQNDWNYIDHDVVSDMGDNEFESNIIHNLKPATKYAIFIQANVLVNPSKDNKSVEPTKSASSDIVYFTTSPAQPSKPENMISTSTSPNEIEATWQPPLLPNGKIVYYDVLIESVKESRIEVDNCEDTSSPMYNTQNEKSQNNYKNSLNTFTSPITNQQCCKCAVKNADDRKKEIDLENKLINTIYYRNNANKPLNLNNNSIFDQYFDDIEMEEIMISVNTTKFRKQINVKNLNENQRNIVDKMAKLNDSKYYQMKIFDFESFKLNLNQIIDLKLNITNLAKIGLSDDQIKMFNLTETELNLYNSYKAAFIELHRTSEFRNYINQRRKRDAHANVSLANSTSEHVNMYEKLESELAKASNADNNKIVFQTTTNETRIKIDKLEHFTHYLIKVSACQNVSDSLLNKIKQCSVPLIQSINTKPLPGADDILLANVSFVDKVVLIKWLEPERPNGQIKFYRISYRLEGTDQKAETLVCVTSKQYQTEANGFRLTNLQPGQYIFRLMTVTTAGKSNWTQDLQLLVEAEKDKLILIIGVIVLILLVLIVLGYLLYERKRKKEELFYASVNPDYIEYDPDEWEIQRDYVKFDLNATIGKGNYGQVYAGEYYKPNDMIVKVAVKTSSSQSDGERNRFLNEASTMKCIDCYHVISLIGVVSKGIPVLVLMELMEAGDLKTYLRNHRPTIGDDKSSDISKKNTNNNNSNERITLDQLLMWATQIADGMAYLAANKFAHCDLAARNCLLSADLVAKVGDFGMAKDVYEKYYYKKTSMTKLPIRWCSPESLRDGLFTSQGDVWSYGVVIYEMVTMGSQPYQGLSNDEVINFVTVQNRRMDMPEDCPENLWTIMELCWERQPEKRPLFPNIIELLLNSVNETNKATFKEKSFYHNHVEKGKSEARNSKRTKKDLKKEEYLEKDVLQDEDGSHEPLTHQKELQCDSELRGDSEFQQFLSNSSNNNSEMHRLSEMTSKESDLNVGSENDSNLSSRSSNMPDDVIVEFVSPETPMKVDKRAEFKNHQQLTSLQNSSTSSLNNKQSSKGSISYQSSSGTSTSNEENLSIADNLITQQNSKNGQQLTSLHNSSTSSLNNRKSRGKSISYQSSSGTSTSNEENFSIAADNLISQQISSKIIPVNGNLPNGNIF